VTRGWALTVSDPHNPARYFTVRGRVLTVTEDGAADHIEKLAQRYLGGPYPWYGGRDQRRHVAAEPGTEPVRNVCEDRVARAGAAAGVVAMAEG
jgi:hypothetical protein